MAPRISCDAMVVCDPAMVKLMRLVEHVAPSDANVLIIGETGTGKKLVAEHLHQYSGRDAQPFVSIDCAATPMPVLENELFVYGSNVACRTGNFEAVRAGTLLLDQIGEMDLPMQAKVLRAVQWQETNPAVRIVATSNKNLQKEVRLGRFREDLFFRLNVVTLRVPPLRERPDDIPALAAFFIEKFAKAAGRSASPLSSGALAVLRRHCWFGNVRELENVMHRAVLIEDGPTITAASLALDPIEEDNDLTEEDAPRPAEPVTVYTAGRTIEAVEKDMILGALYQCKGHRSQAASMLGISIRTLRNKLHEYERSGTRIPRPVVVAMV